MKQNAKAYWQTLPAEGTYPSTHLGYVLFAGDDEEGRVLASRVADPTLCRGESFYHRLALSVEEITEVRAALSSGETCLLVSALGVGLLSARYDLWAGFFVYIHIHEDPKALRRLFCHESLIPKNVLPSPLGGLRSRSSPTAEDAPVLIRLRGSLADLTASKSACLSGAADSPLPLSAVRELILAVARLSGGEWTLTAGDGEEETVLCPAPRMAEAMCVYWTCLMASVSANGRAACHIKACQRAEGRSPAIRWETTVDRGLLSGDTEESVHLLRDMDHMAYRAELNGARVSLTASESPDGCLLTAELTLEKNPAKDPPPSLKTRPKLKF